MYVTASPYTTNRICGCSAAKPLPLAAAAAGPPELPTSSNVPMPPGVAMRHTLLYVIQNFLRRRGCCRISSWEGETALGPHHRTAPGKKVVKLESQRGCHEAVQLRLKRQADAQPQRGGPLNKRRATVRSLYAAPPGDVMDTNTNERA